MVSIDTTKKLNRSFFVFDLCKPNIMLCNKTLVPNQRYLFTIKTPYMTRHFQANFIEIINNTLRVTQYQNVDSNNFPSRGIHCMPKGWIEKVESLPDAVLIDDILISVE